MKSVRKFVWAGETRLKNLDVGLPALVSVTEKDEVFIKLSA